MFPSFKNLELLSVFLLQLQVISGNNFPGRIIGGIDSNAGQFPFSVAIFVKTANSNFFCGGSLLNQNWIITAGHCVYNAVDFTVQVGSNLLSGEDSNRQIVATSEYVVHPDFDPDAIDNDIGLIKLRLPLRYTQYIQPVYLPFGNISDGVISIGWGQTNDHDPNLSNNLKYVDTKVLSATECQSIYGNQITENMMCVEGNYNEGTCIGDNGSPLLEYYMYQLHWIVGISSFISGNGCESTDPSGYTRVLPYTEWIRNITGA